MVQRRGAGGPHGTSVPHGTFCSRLLPPVNGGSTPSVSRFPRALRDAVDERTGSHLVDLAPTGEGGQEHRGLARGVKELAGRSLGQRTHLVAVGSEGGVRVHVGRESEHAVGGDGSLLTELVDARDVLKLVGGRRIAAW